MEHDAPLSLEELLKQCLDLDLINSFRFEDDRIVVVISSGTFRLRVGEARSFLKNLLRRGRLPTAE